MERVARSRKKDKDLELKGLYGQLIEHSKMVVDRSLETIHQFNKRKQQASPTVQCRGEQLGSVLQYYIAAAEYVSELARRRVIEDEKIPNCDKVFSIFEADTELINRGKQPNPIEFGHRVLLTRWKNTCLFHSIVL